MVGKSKKNKIMTKYIIQSLFLIFILSAIACTNISKENKYDKQVPEWSKNQIWYQIFVERFNNGDTTNDPTRESIYTASALLEIPESWHVSDWTQDWYKQEEWAKQTGENFQTTLQHRRYGGDIQGILDKLDYLEDLGITAIYLNPINDAPSLHKYDVRNYRHIDINFGPDPEGDLELIKKENPADPNTWVWTSADKLFLKLVDELHKRNIRVILDYSWNHTGVEFWAWRDILKNQEKSKYKDWYNITSFDNPETDSNEFSYQGWLNLSSLPEFKKIDIKGERIHGKPYEGNMIEPVKNHIKAVTKRWLAPDGDVSKGIDGYRLDVADQIPMGFWREYYSYVKSINKDAYLVGEIWWESWPDVLMNPVPYVKDSVFDAVMFYQVYKPARMFFAEPEVCITAEQFVDSLNFQWNRLPENVKYAMMNTAATHDSPRLLTSFANKSKYKVGAKPYENSDYITGKPDNETYQRVKLYLMHAFTNIGNPHIWNGDEMGMWGADDPDCRKPLWWSEFTFKPENRNNITENEFVADSVGFNNDMFEYYKNLIKIRKNNPVLSNGDIEFLYAKGKQLVYKRFNDKGEEILVLFNLDKDEFEYTINNSKKYKDLFTMEEIKSKVKLQPLSGIIVKNND